MRQRRERSDKEDLTGQLFGELTVISSAGTYYSPNDNASGQCSLWNCRCSCGKEKVVRGHHLKSGKTKTCGCRYTNRGYSNVYPGQPTWFSFLWTNYNKSAKKRNYVFELNHQEFKTLITSNCYYCGQPPEKRKSTPADVFFANGIDRKINEIGYTKDNCVSCCSTCNKMKMTMNFEKFLEHTFKIANHNRC